MKFHVEFTTSALPLKGPCTWTGNAVVFDPAMDIVTDPAVVSENELPDGAAIVITAPVAFAVIPDTPNRFISLANFAAMVVGVSPDMVV